MRVAVTILAFCVTSLLALGLVMLYSSSMTQVGAQYLQLQLVWCFLGFILCVAAAAFDYQQLKKIVWPFFLLALVLLVLVLLPLPHGLTKKINGAHRWFILPGMRLQPSELGKLALIIALAWYGDRYQRKMQTFRWGICLPVVIIAAILGLVFVEPDRGTTILLAAVSGSILLLAGVQWKFIIPPVILAAVGLAVSIWHDPMRMKRIFSWLDMEQNKEGVGYQAYQAMIALGSGGWTGLGLGNGRQKLGWVPEHHTDFIFSIIGEELGLLATLLVILAFVVIALCGIYIALHARDTFGTLLAIGITLLISLQAAINIGVVTSALPNKGLPLPFISYGGSNLLAMFTCVGILFSVARQANPAKITASDFVADENQNPFAAKAT
ncbi:MAG TPA: putative lipid II flippase FtsW [Verrucomicrobia subdivision 3 bacterium]|nr:putative lipid II flippase FtsW [Limisphaerales bacterium]